MSWTNIKTIIEIRNSGPLKIKKQNDWKRKGIELWRSIGEFRFEYCQYVFLNF